MAGTGLLDMVVEAYKLERPPSQLERARCRNRPLAHVVEAVRATGFDLERIGGYREVLGAPFPPTLHDGLSRTLYP